MNWTAILSLLVQAYLGWLYSRQMLKFARALKLDSTLANGVIFWLAVLWPLSMFLVLTARVKAGSRTPLFLSVRREKAWKAQLRHEQDDQLRCQAKQDWEDWTEREVFVRSQLKLVEPGKDWLEHERLTAQLEFLTATKPAFSPSGKTLKTEPAEMPKPPQAECTACLSDERTSLTARDMLEPRSAKSGFCNVCGDSFPRRSFIKEGVCRGCFDELF